MWGAGQDKRELSGLREETDRLTGRGQSPLSLPSSLHGVSLRLAPDKGVEHLRFPCMRHQGLTSGPEHRVPCSVIRSLSPRLRTRPLHAWFPATLKHCCFTLSPLAMLFWNALNVLPYPIFQTFFCPAGLSQPSPP